VREAEESPVLETVARERLVKALQTGEYLACSDVEISDTAVITSVSNGVCKWSVLPFTNPYPVYRHTPEIVTVCTLKHFTTTSTIHNNQRSHLTVSVDVVMKKRALLEKLIVAQPFM
jgi:hypothetical protein